jgi:hypothetical protein
MKRRKKSNAPLLLHQPDAVAEKKESLKLWHCILAAAVALIIFAQSARGLWERELTIDKTLYVGDEAVVMALGWLCFGIGYCLVMTSFAVEQWPRQASRLRLFHALPRPKVLRWCGLGLIYSCGLFYLQANSMAGYDIQGPLKFGFITVLLNALLGWVIPRLTKRRTEVSVELANGD